MRPASLFGIVEIAKLAELQSASCDNGGCPFLFEAVSNVPRSAFSNSALHQILQCQRVKGFSRKLCYILITDTRAGFRAKQPTLAVVLDCDVKTSQKMRPATNGQRQHPPLTLVPLCNEFRENN